MIQAFRDRLAKTLGEEIHLERPANPDHGDWSTNVALVKAKQEGKNPRELAAEILEKINSNSELLAELKIQSVEIAGPGFINFKISPSYYQDELLKIDNKYGGGFANQKLRVVNEMGDPNTHKFPHIGHLFNYVAGDSVARIFKFAGHEIKKVTWQGDVGPQVAKCIYGWRELGKPDPVDSVERMRILQEAYVRGSQIYEEDETAKEKIKAMTKAIYVGEDEELMADWGLTKTWSLEFQDYFEELLGIFIEQRYFEGDLWRQGEAVVNANIGTVFEESEGAIIFPGKKHGLHNRVFLTSQGTPTYEAKEIGLNIQKGKDFPYDLTIIPTGQEQTEYFQVVIKAIEMAVPDLKGKILHIGTGMVQLSSGKMSSRKGNILTAYDLVQSVRERVLSKVQSRSDIPAVEVKDITNKVTIAAIKYAFLRGNILQDLVFDLEESVSFEGNSGPYLLYTYARIQSVLRQKDAPSIQKDSVNGIETHTLSALEELALLKELSKFQEVVEKALDNLAPHVISNYTFELTQKFNQFYREHSINSAETPELVASRRMLAEKTAIVIKSALELLGIETVERM